MNTYFSNENYSQAGRILLSSFLFAAENEEAYQAFKAEASVVSLQHRTFMANLKKANSVTLARRLERMTGEITFNPWQERREVIAKLFTLALQNGTLSRMPQNPRMGSNALRMVLGLPALNEIRRSQGVMSREDVMQVLELRGLGLTYREISEIVGCSDNMACAIATGMSYTHFTGLSYSKKSA